MITFHWSLDLMVIVIAAITGGYLYMTRNFHYWKKRGVMEIPPTPFIGNFGDCLFMRRSPGHFLKDLYDRSANLRYMGFYIFDRPFFLVRDPELIKNILVRDSDCFVNRFASASPSDTIGHASLFLLKNPAWKFVRTKLTPIFTSGKLKKMFELMVEVSEDLRAHLNSLDLRGQEGVIEVKELCARYTTDMIGTTAFGLKVNSLNNPDAEFRRYGREIFDYNLWRSIEFTSAFFAPQFAKVMGFKFFTDKTSSFLRRVFMDTFASREESGARRNDFVDLLMDLKKSQAGSADRQIFEFSGDNLVAQAVLFFAGGFETSSTVLSFAMYELALAPKVQTKLREEIKEAIKENGGKITYDMVANLPYLDMVLAETLRKYQPLPFLDRVAMEDYRIPNSDLVLEKGTPVYISMLGLSYDPEYFPDPEVFDPERFNEENKKQRKSGVFIPFGDGPHTCIAMRLGLLQSKLGLVNIVLDYQLSPCDKTLIPMKFNPKALVTASDGGLFLNFKKINVGVFKDSEGPSRAL